LEDETAYEFPKSISPDRGPYAVTADGKKFLINSGDLKEESQPFTLVQNWPTALKK